MQKSTPVSVSLNLSVWCWQEQAFGAVAAAGATDVDAVSREVAAVTHAEVSCLIVPTHTLIWRPFVLCSSAACLHRPECH